MARLITAGAEWGEATADGVTLASGTVSSANPRTGSFHYRQHTASPMSAAFTGALSTTYYLRVYANFSILPSSTGFVVAGFGDSGTTRVSVRLNNDGSLDLRSGGATIVASLPAGTVSAGAYFMAEISYKVNGSTSRDIEGRFNGSSFGSVTGDSGAGFIAPTAAFFGHSDATNNVDIDDLALNDSTGAAQNSWPGSGKVVLLKPISLNANGGSWTDSAAATTSAALADAIDNTPPTGIADTTASAGHQDRNAAANSSLDMNLTTYTTAGVGASDTVNVLQPMCSTGAPVVTGAKTGSLGITTNPTIANAAFVNGASTAANFWSGVAAGTFATGWKWEKGTTTYAPSVTLGSSPVARVTITGGTTSRIAMVDALGMLVDYTPAVPATKAPPFQPRTARNSLLRR